MLLDLRVQRSFTSIDNISNFINCVIFLQGDPGKDGSAGNTGPAGATVSDQTSVTNLVIVLSFSQGAPGPAGGVGLGGPQGAPVSDNTYCRHQNKLPISYFYYTRVNGEYPSFF